MIKVLRQITNQKHIVSQQVTINRNNILCLQAEDLYIDGPAEIATDLDGEKEPSL